MVCVVVFVMLLVLNIESLIECFVKVFVGILCFGFDEVIKYLLVKDVWVVGV